MEIMTLKSNFLFYMCVQLATRITGFTSR